MRFVLAAVFAITAVSAQDPKKDPDQIGTRDVSKGVNWYSIQREIALGKQLATQVAQTAHIVNDPEVSEYVNRLAQNLARNSDAKFPLTTQVIQDPTINALSLPGGFFFVNTGLILAADTEAELAGGMAHEIAHIAARHATRTATRGEIAQLATVPLIFMGGWPGYGARQAASVLIPIQFLQFSRAFEAEADLLGIEYLYKTGYDPEAMVDMFEKIQALGQKQPGLVAKVFSTHPATGDRIVQTQKNIQELLKEQPQYVISTSEFDRVKARLLALENRRKNQPYDPNRPVLRHPVDPKLAETVKYPVARKSRIA
jgi:predicted Zn-dependent protease